MQIKPYNKEGVMDWTNAICSTNTPLPNKAYDILQVRGNSLASICSLCKSYSNVQLFKLPSISLLADLWYLNDINRSKHDAIIFKSIFIYYQCHMVYKKLYQV